MFKKIKSLGESLPHKEVPEVEYLFIKIFKLIVTVLASRCMLGVDAPTHVLTGVQFCIIKCFCTNGDRYYYNRSSEYLENIFLI